MKKKDKSHPLKKERELRGWSQAKVAEALNTAIRSISRWEQGQALPFPFYREQLCQLFSKNACQLGLLLEHEEREEHNSISAINQQVIHVQMQKWYEFLETSA